MPRSQIPERDALEAGLTELGLAADPLVVDRLLRFIDLLRRWGRTYNLVAPGELDRLLARHVLDALAIHDHLKPGALLDVGTGAGFPGLPLAVVRPDESAVLLDSAGKKIRFLNHVVRELGLEWVTPVHERVGRFSPERDFSTITSRAFSSLADFASAVRHLAQPATRLLAMKGHLPDEELVALPPWVRVEDVTPLAVPGLEEARHLVTLAVTEPA